MFSTEYLERFDDNKLKSGTMSAQWQNEYLDRVEAGTSSQQRVPSNEDILREYESEWDNILQRGATEAESSFMNYQEPYAFNAVGHLRRFALLDAQWFSKTLSWTIKTRRQEAQRCYVVETYPKQFCTTSLPCKGIRRMQMHVHR